MRSAWAAPSAVPDAKQDREACADRSHDVAVDTDVGARDPLDDCPHGAKGRLPAHVFC